jgi:NADH-quinone oxidoreductase subunit J
MIIYVGAIAILFLFVIMMLDLKDFEEDENYSKEETITLLFGFILLKFLWLTFLKMGSDPLYIFDHYFDDPTGIDLIGQSLYNFLLPYFLIIGLILLVALIGCIVLTLKLDKVNKEKSAQQNNHLQYKNSQYGFRQLSRTDNFLSHFNS